MFNFIHILLQVETGSSVLLRSDKIYTVLTVLLIIFVVLIGYLVSVNKKVNQLEQKIDNLKE